MGIETTNIYGLDEQKRQSIALTQSWVPPRGFSSASVNSLRDPTPGSSQTKAMSIACLPAVLAIQNVWPFMGIFRGHIKQNKGIWDIIGIY